MKPNLDGHVVVLTGAGRGIGLAMACELYRQGAKLVLCDADKERLGQAVLQLPGSDATIQSHCIDVGDASAVEAVADSALASFGKIDIWINNAGIARHAPVIDYSQKDIDRMVNTNLKGTFWGCQAAMRHMTERKQGTIMNVTSTASLKGIPTESFYCATKWAVRGFTQALQEEAAPYGIRVINLLPGGVDTPFWDEAVDHKMPVEAFLTPEHVAEVAVSALLQPNEVVVRDIVVRSVNDRDYAGRF